MLVSVITSPEQIAASLPLADMFEFRLDHLYGTRPALVNFGEHLLSPSALLDLENLSKFPSISATHWDSKSAAKNSPNLTAHRIREIPKSPLPVMFTYRKKEQGGKGELAEDERLTRLEKLLEYGPEYCDLEADTDPLWIERLAKKFPNVKFVGSYHNFTETPDDLETLYQSMRRPEFSLYKIATTAQSTLDMLRLFEFARGKKNLAWISMGKLGQPSRILSPLTGSPFCYATLDEESPPLFQVNLQTLVQLYRIRTLNEKTKIFALIGNPLEASIGYLYHNQVFAEKNENAVYVNLPVLQDELDELFEIFRRLPFVGISVTMPYKTSVIPFLDELGQDAEKIGAVNTILFRGGKAIGYNTDGIGACDALEQHLPLKKKKIALLGAGGASRAVAFELAQRGAEITIFNRTFETAEKLAAYLGCRASHFEELYSGKFDLLINAIPHPPIDLDRLAFPPFVMDIAVTTQESPLLQKAKEQGCHAIEAKEMFYEQAKLQQKLWHNS